MSTAGYVNFTLRPYYAEGSKTVLFECAEQLGWRLPHHIVVPVGSGALLTRQATAANQLRATGLVPESHFHIHAAQPAGCAPVSDAVLDNWRPVEPVRKPQTLAKSLAIGAPADGDGSVKIIRDTRGSAASVSDDEIRAAATLLATTEGVLVEPRAASLSRPRSSSRRAVCSTQARPSSCISPATATRVVRKKAHSVRSSTRTPTRSASKYEEVIK